ncbi:MAG TPA: DUF3606 domain-containing protein [Bacteriovoracaceae bacterium]|nr:DUF3606 domain-containing protein [Bacteriovoracaceae bacterium]
MNDLSQDLNLSEDKKIDFKHINFWCEELGLKSEDLRDIVQLVGPAVHDVRVYLAKKLLISWPAHY